MYIRTLKMDLKSYTSILLFACRLNHMGPSGLLLLPAQAQQNPPDKLGTIALGDTQAMSPLKGLAAKQP